MKRCGLFLLPLLAWAPLLAQPVFRDVLYREHGSPLTGRVVRADETHLHCEIVLKEGQPPAQISLSRADIKRVVFADDEERHLRNASPEKLAEIEARWRELRPFLSLPESNAGSVGLRFADLLLEKSNNEHARNIFGEIETVDWNGARKAQARIGRLRAMLALGQTKDAVAEAHRIGKETDEPGLLIEAKFILAESGFLAFRKLLEENPRWSEDENIVPERNRLYHETIDLYLYPYLFHGAEETAAARGLWRAVELYKLAGAEKQATETAADLLALYPNTPEAALAAKLEIK